MLSKIKQELEKRSQEQKKASPARYWFFHTMVLLSLLASIYLYYQQIPLVIRLNELQQRFFNWGSSPTSYLYDKYVPLLSLLVLFLCFLIPLAVLRLLVEYYQKKEKAV